MNNQTKSNALFLVAYLRKGYRTVLKIMAFFTIYFNSAFILNLLFWITPCATERENQQVVLPLRFSGISGLVSSEIVNRRC
jgi:hypothetical protein